MAGQLGGVRSEGCGMILVKRLSEALRELSMTAQLGNQRGPKVAG